MTEATRGVLETSVLIDHDLLLLNDFPMNRQLLP
jgi:hypothetical protein